MLTPTSYHKRLQNILCANESTIEFGVQALAVRLLEGAKNDLSVWLAGNGGSASTAEHWETDLTYVRFRSRLTVPKVQSLTPNSSLITAIANDLEYEDIFSLALERKAKPGDLFIAISASGNSPNILRSLTFAKQIHLETFSLLGFNGGQAKSLSDSYIHVETELGEYGIVEDIHVSICHAVTERLRELQR